MRKGWSLPVSGYIIARNRWRDAYKFATCKSCKGVGGYISKAVLLYKELINKSIILYDKKDEKRNYKHNKIDHSSYIMNGENITDDENNNNLQTHSSDSNNVMTTNNDSNNLRHSFLISTPTPTSASTSTSTSAPPPYQTPASIKRQAAIVAATMIDTKHRLLWKIPELLVSFLSNLPINLCGVTPHNKSWVLRQLFQILNMKRINDKEDMDMGLGVQVIYYYFHYLLRYYYIFINDNLFIYYYGY